MEPSGERLLGLTIVWHIGFALSLGLVDGIFGAVRSGGWLGIPSILIIHLCLQGLISGTFFVLLGARVQGIDPRTWSSRTVLEALLLLPAAAFMFSQLIHSLKNQFATALYNGLFQSLVALVGVGLTWLVIRRLLDHLPTQRLPSPRILLTVLGSGAVLGYGFLWWRRDLLFKEIDPWLPLAASLHLLLALAAQNRQRGIDWRAFVAPLAGFLFLFPASLLPGSHALTWGQRCMGCYVFPPLSQAFDRDGDGVGHILGGRDCDPEDPGIYPGAVEIPDDGLDQDCFGGDLTLGNQSAPKPSTRPFRSEALSQLVVLVTIDTLRADHMGLYGYQRPTTPGIDAWAQQGLVFERALTSAPYTTGAIPGIITGRAVSELRSALPDEIFRIPPSIPTLAEQFKAGGYETAGFVTALNTAKSYGYRRGFQTFAELTRQYADTAQSTVRRAQDWLAAYPTGKRFLWLHFFDPHAPYERYPEFDFGGSDLDRYDSTIAQLDRALSPLLRQLNEEQGALVLLTADHGESFGEHGHHKHGRDLYDPVMRVPLVVRGPGIESQRSRTVASTLDITPTLSSLSGLPVTHSTYGKDLSPLLLNGQQFPERMVFAEQDLNLPQALLGTAEHTLIYSLLTSRFELYSTQDSAQLRNLWGQQPNVDNRLQMEMAKRIDQGPARRRAQLLSRAVVKAVPAEGIRLDPPQRFGDRIELVGYRFWSEQVARERHPQFRLSLYLRAIKPLKKRWQIALGMDKGGRRSNLDHHLAQGNLPSHHWPAGRILHDPVKLGSLNSFPEGPAVFSLGFYAGDARLRPQTGSLAQTTSGTRVMLGPLPTP